MNTIKIDDDVMRYLKSKADPFNDSPNSVLRRVLGLDKSKTTKSRNENLKGGIMKSDEFVRKVISEHYNYEERPQKVGRFRYLFNLDGKLVYFQNFNEPTNNLWYRLRSNAIEKLKNKNGSEIVLTYPVERVFYIIKVADLVEKLDQNNWKRDDIEVNIDPDQDFWRELSWRLNKFEIS